MKMLLKSFAIMLLLMKKKFKLKRKMWSKLGKSVSSCGKREYMMFGMSVTVSASIMMVPTKLNIYIALIRTAISSGGTPQRKILQM